MTQIDAARRGEITPQIAQVAKDEFRDPEFVRERVAAGRIAIPANINHENLHAHGVGEGLRTKVNVNLGISGDIQDAPQEWEKVAIAEKFGADAIMDLSNSGKTRVFRRQLIEKTPLMVGTVPMYDAIGYLETPLVKLTGDDLLRVVRAHAEDGVDFMTIHAGFNRRVLDTFMETGRLTNIVSRGGSLLFGWMMTTGKENPFYERFDEVLEICHEYDVTISLGDACRGGSTYDATDASEVAELVELGKLTKRAWDAGVQVVVEGPGHMALDEVAANMKLQKRLCHNAPFYVLGPLVTDIAPGYDHRRHRRGRGGKHRRRLALLRDARRAPEAPRRQRRPRGPRGHAHRRPRRRHCQGRPARPRHRQQDERRPPPRGLGRHVGVRPRSGARAGDLGPGAALGGRNVHDVRKDVRRAHRQPHHGGPDHRPWRG